MGRPPQGLGEEEHGGLATTGDDSVRVEAARTLRIAAVANRAACTLTLAQQPGAPAAEAEALYRHTVADCDAAIALQPEHTKAWFRRATAHAAVDAPAAALHDVTACLRLDPANQARHPHPGPS